MKLKLLIGITLSVSGAAAMAACADSTNTDGTSSSSSSGSTSSSSGSTSSSSGSSSSASSSGSTSSSSGSTSSSSSSGSTSSSSSSSSGSSGDAGVGPKNTKLKDGDTLLIGVTTGATPHAVYYLSKGGNVYDVEAVALSNGAVTVLKAGIGDADNAYVSGGAVAFYTGTVSNIATSVSVWTKTNGIKTVNTPTRQGLFAANADGTLVAFSANATATSTDVTLTTSAAPSAASPALTTDNAVNLAALSKCSPQIGFAGSVLVGSYCTGVDANATQPKLVTAASGAAAVVRIDNADVADAFQSGWIADSTGGKIFVRGPAPTNEGRIVLAGATTTVAVVDTDVTGAAIPKDGSALIYTTSTALKKATFAAAPVVTSLVGTNVKGLLGLSGDSKRALYYTQEDAAEGLIDAYTVDFTAAVPAPVAIVATPTASPTGFTADGASVVYVDEWGAATGKLKSKPAGGGAEKLLDAASNGAFVAGAGSGALSIASYADVSGGGGYYGLVLKYTDASVGGALQAAASDVLYSTNGDDTFFWSGKTLAHVNTSAGAPGVYALTLP